MAVSLAELPKAHEFAEAKFELTPEWIEEYRAAVDDESTPSSVVPPLSLVALTFGRLLEQAALPDGAIHVSQELRSFKAVSPGGRVVVRARVGSRGARAGWVLMSLELDVAEETGDTLVGGRATITFPAEEEE